MKSAEEWIHYCETKAAEAASLAIGCGLDEAAITAVTKSTFFDSLPPCAGGTIKFFVACVAHGALVRLVEPQEAKTMLYAAQVALQANNAAKRRTNDKRK